MPRYWLCDIILKITNKGEYDQNDKSKIYIQNAESTRGNLNVAYHTQAEISAHIKNDGVSLNDPLSYVIEPQLAAPYDQAGVLSQDTLDAAIKMMNQIRYIAGLHDNVTLNEDCNRKAQAAALVNYVNRKLSHDPSRPDGMSESLYSLGQTGFGAVYGPSGTYSALYR